MSGHHKLEGKNLKIALKMLHNITDVLDKHQIPYWLEGGTLLGIIRENRLLPWDNDMDISIKEEYAQKLEIALKDLKYRVRYKEFEKDDMPFKSGIKRLYKIRNNRFFFFRGTVTLDIFIKFRFEDKYFWQIGGCKKSVPAHFYDELGSIEFNDKKYLIPQLFDEYLTHRYGDWTIPVKEWNTFKDDKALGEKQ